MADDRGSRVSSKGRKRSRVALDGGGGSGGAVDSTYQQHEENHGCEVGSTSVLERERGASNPCGHFKPLFEVCGALSVAVTACARQSSGCPG